MLPRKNRLDPKEAKEFKKKVSSDFFSIYFLGKKNESPRFLIVVGSKVHTSAFLRNRLKRQMREALKSTKTNKDAVLVALPSSRKLDSIGVNREVKELLRKI